MRCTTRLSATIVATTLLAACGYGEVGAGRQMLPVDELGPEDREGEPAVFTSAVLPDSVDHSPGLAPVRDQAGEGTCMSFATTAAVEAFYRLGVSLSVEQMIKHLKLPNGLLLGLRLRGVRLAEEKYWPYQGQPKPDADQHRRWGVDRTRSTGVDPTTLMQYLAQGPSSNVVVGYCHDQAYERTSTEMVNPRLSDRQAWWRRLTCNPQGMIDGTSGGHAVLLVGYEKRMDSDGALRVFFKFKNSWGEYWGEGGYGFMSSEYVRQLGISGLLVTAGPKVN